MSSSSSGLGFLIAAGFVARSLSQRRSTTVAYTCGPDCGCTSSTTRRAPAIPDRSGPLKKELAPGASVWLCTCGLSKRYPLCDGSHKGSTFSPVKMTNETAEPVVKYLCSCGHSKKTDGTCDGSHRKINLAQ